MAGAKLLTGNAVVGQSGGPTAVINQSLVGVVEGLRAGLRATGNVQKILGMRHGVNGLTKGDLVDLTEIPQDKLERVANTPSASLGSSRDKPDKDYCARILKSCEQHGIRYFFYIGGNDSSDTCRIVNELARAASYELRCFHVPKTVDNDLPVNDHTPGFPSAARFVAMAFAADSLDNRSLPGIKINVIMGRHAGFLTAASALARGIGGDPDDGPHLIYVPEVALVLRLAQRRHPRRDRPPLGATRGWRHDRRAARGIGVEPRLRHADRPLRRHVGVHRRSDLRRPCHG